MIPKIIHYCWFGGNPLPDEYKKYMESWRKFCPDYEIIEWNESNYDVTKNKYMHEAYEAKKWAFVSDYARLDIIYNHGGIYLDTDVELIKSLDDLLINEAYMGMESKYYVATGLGFGAIKGHKVVKELRDYYDDMSFFNPDGSYNLTPCPIYQTQCLMKKGLVQKNEKQLIRGVTIYPSEYFSPISPTGFKQKLTPNTYSIHHYSASWKDDIQRAKKAYRMKLSKYLGKIPTQIIITIKFHGIKYTIKKIIEKAFKIGKKRCKNDS